MKFKLFIIFISIYNVSISQVPDLSNWKLDSLPNTENRIHKVHMTGPQWRFLKSRDNWKIVKNEYNFDRGDSLPLKTGYLENNLKIKSWYRYVKKIPDGYLIGVRFFEAYGLYFVSDDGLSGYKMPGPLMIHQIFEYNGKYYALDGNPQAHELSQKGQLLEIYKKGNVWTYKTVIKMIDAPELLTDYKNEKLIITANSILKFGKDLKPKELLKSPFFFGILGPFSMLVNNDDLYIAMQGGVLKIKTFDSKPSYEWWVPK